MAAQRYPVFLALAGLAVLPLPGITGVRPDDGASVRVVATYPGAYWKPQVLRAEGPLSESLYRSFGRVLHDSLLNQRERAYMAWEIAEVFRWEADFTRDIRRGDRFTLVFERLLSPYGEVRYGRLLAAEIVLGGDTLSAYEFDDPYGRTAFYDAEGRSLRRDFLRVPVEFKRISSEFGARFHPILRRWRDHQGIDYAAGAGSPVRAVGEGTVLRATTAGGYGKLVEVDHGNGVVTRYAHLRGYGPGVRRGARLEQGQVLGYVGKTGLATGPHLHFEFRVRGEARDPREITTGTGPAVADGARPAFASAVEEYRRLLAN